MRIVMKFGGTSLSSLEHISRVAELVYSKAAKGCETCVVVSAMAGVTNQLVDYVKRSSKVYDAREYDTVVSAGEQVTAGLLALMLQQRGLEARSWLGWQAGIKTSDTHGRARISSIDGSRLVAYLETGGVAVMAGFQGHHPETNRITTLGRGGSDTSAVALAIAIDSDSCDIYTDVEGVYTTDPRIVPQAKKLKKISYEEMLEMASLGSKVLQARSVELAMKYAMPIRVLSSFKDTLGTLITSEDKDMEKKSVVGVTTTKDEAQITVIGILDAPSIAAKVFSPIGDAKINVDMIVQSTSRDGRVADVTFTIAENDLDRTLAILNAKRDVIGFEDVHADSNVAKVSIVGIGMRCHTEVAHTMFKTLASKNINIKSISTSEIKISVLIERDYVELALRSLHDAYKLDEE